VNAVLWPRVADTVRKMIAAGDLAPGDLTPTAVALSDLTGASAQTCRKAVLIMARKGELVPPPSRSGRPRVPGGDGPGPRERELSAALVAAREALSLTQDQLAGLAGMSWTTVHLAETGRFQSQGPEVWARLDRATYSDGLLVRMHAAWQAPDGNR
jgi:DNA-binding transcriptional MocR family regulator